MIDLCHCYVSSLEGKHGKIDPNRSIVSFAAVHVTVAHLIHLDLSYKAGNARDKARKPNLPRSILESAKVEVCQGCEAQRLLYKAPVKFVPDF